MGDGFEDEGGIWLPVGVVILAVRSLALLLDASIV